MRQNISTVLDQLGLPYIKGHVTSTDTAAGIGNARKFMQDTATHFDPAVHIAYLKRVTTPNARREEIG